MVYNHSGPHQTLTRKVLTVRAFDMEQESRAEKARTMGPIVKDMIRIDKESECREIKAFAKKVILVLLNNDLAEKAMYNAEHVAVHKDNRSGGGAEAYDVQTLLVMLSTQGWSSDETHGAMASEMAPRGYKMRADQVSFNKDLAYHSDGHLPPFYEDQTKILAFACTHTVTAIKSAKMGVKPTDASGNKEMCKDGKLSQALLLERAPSFQEPLQKGVFFTVIRWEIEEEVPELIEILMEAGNAGHHVERVLTDLQTCLQLWRKAMRETDDANVLESVGKYRAQGDKTMLENMLKYVRKYAGGENGYLLKQLESFSQGLKVRRR